MQSIKNYWLGTREYSTARFIFEMTLLCFVLKIVIGATLLSLLGLKAESTTVAADVGGPLLLFVTACVFAPLLETALGQWLPIWFGSLFTRRLVPLLLFSTVLFAASHLHVGITGFITTFGPGLVLAWSFLAKRTVSVWHAYWITALIHALHNGLILPLYWLRPGGS